MKFVLDSSTCPKLVLGGPSKGEAEPLLTDAYKSLECGADGLLQGRGVLYCGPTDPGAVAHAMYRMAHEGISLQEALQDVNEYSGQGMDMITSRLAK
jgi:DhnA family fructose-bisphosphate aldolase class Ia